MGCTKRLAEIYVQSLGQAIVSGRIEGRTQFITTRFGNVLGSNGSVIPRFREQIEHGGPVTVTHPESRRYFMTIPEACRLVMEAATIGRGNTIFVFDMGECVKIAELARRMIALAGFRVDQDIRIVYTGLRPGEKLYEEVLSNCLLYTSQVLILENAPGGQMLGAALIQVAFNLGNALGAYCGGLPIEYGLGYEYSALPGVGFALLGFVMLTLFVRRYGRRRPRMA